MLRGVLVLVSASILALPTVAIAQTDWEMQVTDQIRTAGLVFEPEGYTLSQNTYTGSLKDEASADFTLVLEAGASYYLVGACDDDCPDIDLMLLDASGNEVDRDYEDDALPRVAVTPTRTASYSVHVYMANCTNEPCYYGVGVFASGSAAGVQGGDKGTQSYSGRLEKGDEQLSSNEYFDMYTFQASAGEEVAVDLRSNDFDPFLILMSPTDKDTQNDDYDGSSSHSRVEKVLDESGEWRVVVTSYSPGDMGAYDLTIATSSDGSGSGSSSGAQFESGQLAGGDYQLTSGEYYDSYTVSGAAGDQIVLDLRSSEFDPYIMLITPSEEQFDNDDHEGDASRSMIAMSLPENGQYDVIVTTYKPGESGAYDLRIDWPTSSVASGNRTERGSLASGDERLESGEYVDGYEFEGTPGQRVRLDVSSSEFDTYLILVDPNGEHAENDDAEGLAGHSVIEADITESGTYVVAVTSYKPKETGSYELNMEFGAAVASAAEQRDVSAIAMDDRMGGRLEDGDLQLDAGEYGDVYVFDGSVGQNISVEMVSPDFDTYLVLVPPDGGQIDNDDHEGSTDRSRIDVTLRESGRFRIVATSYQAGETGSYEVMLSSGETVSAPAVSTSTESGRIYGVFMGISDYPGEADDLMYTAEDALRVRDAMASAGMSAGDAIVLTDDDATAGNLQNAMRTLNGRMGPNDTFILFYSGHGSRIPRSDFQTTDPDAMDETIELYDGPITDDQMNAMFAELNSGTSIIVLDACFSGGFAKDVISAPGRMGLFSSEEDVTSSVAVKFRAGGYLAVFMAEAVGEGRADGDGDGGVSALELSQYLHERYRTDVKSAGPGEYVRTGGPQLGYQHLVVDRGSIGPYDVLFVVPGS